MKKSEALHILGLEDGATEEQIKKAHRKLIIENHPDKFAQDEKRRAEAEETTKKINEAADVLESGKWEPEFGGTRGGSYGTPYTYTYTNQGSQTSGNDPFKGTPFEGFVWTTYTTSNPGQTRTTQGSSSNPYSDFSDPFVGYSSPFAAAAKAAAEANRPENRLKEEKKELNDTLKIFGVKLGIVALCLLASIFTYSNFIAVGLYLYTIITIGQAIVKNMGILSSLVMVPFIMLALIFAPGANSMIGIIGLTAFVIAFVVDLNYIRQHLNAIKQFKAQIGQD